MIMSNYLTNNQYIQHNFFLNLATTIELHQKNRGFRYGRG